MRSEEEIRQLLAIFRAFNAHGRHDVEITAARAALAWVLGEYPEKKAEEAPHANPS